MTKKKIKRGRPVGTVNKLKSKGALPKKIVKPQKAKAAAKVKKAQGKKLDGHQIGLEIIFDELALIKAQNETKLTILNNLMMFVVQSKAENKSRGPYDDEEIIEPEFFDEEESPEHWSQDEARAAFGRV